MLLNQWYAILESAKLNRRPQALQRVGEKIVLWRDAAGRAIAFADRCSHRGAALSMGRVDRDCLECPYHGLRFDGEGRCRLIPANGQAAPIPSGFDLKPLTLREEYGFLWLWPGSGDPGEELPWFDELPGGVENSWTTPFEWDVSFSRVMEGMLDMHHFPFLHSKVAYGMGPLVDPYVADRDGDLIRTRGQLRPDDGRSPAESPGMSIELTVRLPGTLYLKPTPKLQIAAVSAPIDESRTWVAFRYYQRYLPVPFLGRYVAGASALLEKMFVHPDDFRVLRSCEPKESGVGANRLFAADHGVALWLKWYDQQKRAEAAQALASDLVPERPHVVAEARRAVGSR